ncbi:MAG: NAD(P)H-dependent oxidoreductase subunit E [bacterium]
MSEKTCFKLSNELIEFIETWKTKPGNLIMILQKIQEEYGYIRRDNISELSKILGISQAKILGVCTFYHFFKLEAPGKNKISVCTGTACYLKGAGKILEEIKKELNIDIGQITENGKFSLEAVRCIGCCGLAPVMTINGEVFGKLEAKKVKNILKKFRKTITV